MKLSKKLSKKKKRIISIISSIVIIISALVTYLWQEYKAKAPLQVGLMQVHVLDVGNADSTLIRCGDASMLIDAGMSRSGEEIVSYIKSQGIEKLDYVIATHADADHIGGMAKVIENIPIDNFIMPIMPEKSTPTTKTYLNLLEALKTNNIQITKPPVGKYFMLGQARVDIIAPVETSDDTNEMSVVCKIANGNHNFLFMGDAGVKSEKEILLSGVRVRADFIKVGHHGSKGSSSQEFIKAVSPSYAAISCGAENRYGHPSPEVLEILKQNNTKVFRNDYHGLIIVESDGEIITVNTEK